MSNIILYHGSSEIIEKPVFGKGRLYLREIIREGMNADDIRLQ